MLSKNELKITIDENQTKINLTENEKPYDLGEIGKVNRSITIHINNTFCVESKDINSCYPINRFKEFSDHKINKEIGYYVYINNAEEPKTIYIVHDDKKSNPFITASSIFTSYDNDD